MKKQLLVLGAAALLGIGGLTSCGGDKAGGIKVGLICLHDEASTYDKNFITAFTEACNEAKEKGLVSEFRIVANKAENEACKEAAETLVEDGFKAVFTDSFGHDAYLHQVAKNNPSVFFSSATGIEARKSGLPNFHNAFASIYEGRYLAGVAAGQYLLEKGHTAEEKLKVGYVGAYPYAEVISGYTSWYLGVRSVLANAEMDVIYTNSWYSEEKEGTAAATLIKERNCVLISQHADSYGAPNACKENKIPNVSYNFDTTIKDHTFAETYIGHSRINWKPYYEKAIVAAHKSATKDIAEGEKRIADDKIEGETEQNWTGTIQNGSVEYAVSSLVTNKTKITEAETKIKNGTLKVFDCSKFTVNELGNKLSGKDAPVKGKDYEVDAEGHLTKMMGATDMYAPDTDLVKSVDGVTYIQESVFRSAPSFNYIIDGINIAGQYDPDPAE